MKIQYCSDLHLEFLENRKFLREQPIIPEGDVLILSGDIVPFHQLSKQMRFFDFLGDHFEAVYWVPGNHEYYHSELSMRAGSFCESIKSNVFLLNDTAITLGGGVRLLFTTLWSSINPANDWYIERAMRDFELIKYQGRRLSVPVFNELHEKSLEFLEEELQKDYRGTTVVATHHVPTFQHYPEIYRSSGLNEAFATELSLLIESSPINYWIYGHHHANTPDFLIGGTWLVTNQLGYVQHEEHEQFQRSACLVL